MRKILLFLIMVLVPTLLMAQAAGGMITRQKKNVQKSTQKTIEKSDQKTVKQIDRSIIHDTDQGMTQKADEETNQRPDQRTNQGMAQNKDSSGPEVKGQPSNVDEKYITITTKCNVPSADLYIDGKLLGKADGVYRLDEGSHVFRISAESYEMLRYTINVTPQNKEFVFRMKESGQKEASSTSSWYKLAENGLNVIQGLNNQSGK